MTTVCLTSGIGLGSQGSKKSGKSPMKRRQRQRQRNLRLEQL
ncbi:MAG: hypothetical protein NTY19_04395 [Planctomycetota bacterium]|nr:hypothetical protein [Planctomycetota bacterium]